MSTYPAVTLLPRFIRLRDAPYYLGMDRNRFNQAVRPSLPEIPIGQQGIAFDRLDLDHWADHYKQRVVRPIHSIRGELWHDNDKPEPQAYCNEGTTGTLTKKSLDDEYERLLGRPAIRKPRPFSLAESKKLDKPSSSGSDRSGRLRKQ